MKINRNNCETYLRYVIAQVIRANVKTAAALLAVPALYKGLMQAVALWCSFIACRQSTCVEIGRDIGMDLPQMVSDFVNHTFRRGKKGDYPTLTKLLSVACTDGPDAVVPYLMTAVRYRALDLNRRYEVRMERMGELRGYTGDEEYGVVDPGEGRDMSVNLDEDYARQEGLNAFLATMGREPASFASDVCILADAVGIKRSVVCQLFFIGCQEELVALVASRLSAWLHRDVSEHLKGLAEQAHAYVLPARYKADQEALLAHLYRQSSGAMRSRLAERSTACGL